MSAPASVLSPASHGETIKERESQRGGGGTRSYCLRPFEPDSGHAGAGRRAERGVAAPADGCAPGLSKEHISVPTEGSFASVEVFRGASFLRVQLHSSGPEPTPPVRGEITHFTNAARRRMLDLMAKIDASLIPFFVTLTYPDEFPSYHEDFKNHLDLLGQRIRRRWPEVFIVWKLEFEPRKSGVNKGKIAPHYHLFLYNVPWEFEFKRETGRSYSVRHRVFPSDDALHWEVRVRDSSGEHLVHCVSSRISEGAVMLDDLRHWMSRNWYDIVQSNDFRHFSAGTRVERMRSIKGTFYYASKRYMGKEVENLKLEHKPGRFWGVIGRKNLKLGDREVLPLTRKQAVTLLRVLRRYRRANTAPEKRRRCRRPLKLYCNAEFWRQRLPALIGLRLGEANSGLTISAANAGRDGPREALP